LRGRSELPLNKFAVDLAFEGAWRSWAYRSSFSQVATDMRNGSGGQRVATRATSSKRVTGVWWSDADGRWTVTSVDDLDLTDPADVEFVLSVIAGDLPLEAWQDLTTEFLARLDRAP